MLIMIYSKSRIGDRQHYIDYAWTDEEYGFGGILPHDISWWIVPGTINLED